MITIGNEFMGESFEETLLDIGNAIIGVMSHLGIVKV
jgi:hypothetical protein